MRYLRVLPLGLLALAVLTLPAGNGGPADAVPGWPDSTPGVIDSISIDADPTGNTPNGLTGLIDVCTAVPIGGTVSMDIVIDEVDAADLLRDFQVELGFEDTLAGAVRVTGVDTAGQMIAANGGSVHVAGSDPVPDSVSPFLAAAQDSGAGPGSYESGEGVLARITLEGVGPMGIGALTLGVANTTVLDQNGTPITIDKLYQAIIEVGDIDGDTVVDPSQCGSTIDFAIVEETVVGPDEIGLAGGDYTVEKTIRNISSIDPLSATATTEIMPPADCDVGSGFGNLHTIETDAADLPFGVNVAVDVPFQAQCSQPGDYDIHIWNEVQPDGPFLEDMRPENSIVEHDILPGAPPPLTLTPSGSPGPALRVHVMNCQSVPPWSVPPGDSDCDGFTDPEEGFVATDAADDCPDNVDDDAWPADLSSTEGYGKHDGKVNIMDIVQLTPPTFGDCTGEPDYAERKDFDGSGCINIMDIVRLTPPTFNQSCQ